MKRASKLVGVAAVVALAAVSTFIGRVTEVIQGDTLTVLHSGKPEKVLLCGVAAPRLDQPFGAKARQFTSQWVLDKEVNVVVKGQDPAGRKLVEVILQDGRNLNRELIKQGLARWDQQTAPHDYTLKSLEEEARANKRGLWRAPPLPPKQPNPKKKIS